MPGAVVPPMRSSRRSTSISPPATAWARHGRPAATELRISRCTGLRFNTKPGHSGVWTERGRRLSTAQNIRPIRPPEVGHIRWSGADIERNGWTRDGGHEVLAEVPGVDLRRGIDHPRRGCRGRVGAVLAFLQGPAGLFAAAGL